MEFVKLLLLSTTTLALLRVAGGMDVDGSPLFAAFDSKDLNTFKRLVVNAPSLANAKNSDGTSILETVIETGNLPEYLRILLEAGADANTVTQEGLTMVMFAILWNQVDTLWALSQHGADFNTPAVSGTTPLQLAIQHRNGQIIHLLVELGADIDGINSQDGTTALMTTAEEGDVELTSSVLMNMPKIDLQNNNGDTALHIAAEKGHSFVIQLLMENCANTSITNNDGKTAATLGKENNHTLAVSVINRDISLRPHPEPFANTYDGSGRPCTKALVGETRHFKCRVQKCEPESCITFAWINTGKSDPKCVGNMHAAVRDQDLELFRSVLDSNYEIAEGSDDEPPIIFELVEKNLPEFVGVLVENYIYLDALSFSGETALMVAIRSKKKKIFDILLESGAFADFTNREGETPLMIAVELGLTEYVSALLAHHPSVNRKDLKKRGGGKSSLHRAAEVGNIAIVEMLLRSCPDTSIVTSSSSQTARDIAEDHGFTEVIALIDAHVAATCSTDGVTYALGATRLSDCKQLKCESTCKFSRTDEIDPTCVPKIFAALNERNMSAFQDLLASSPNLAKSTDYGLPIIFIAADDDLPNYTRILADKGADLDAPGFSGVRPLLWATQRQYKEIFDILLEYGASVNVVDDEGRSPLMYAAKNNLLEYINALLKDDTDLSLQDNQGLSALHLASQEGHLNAVERLLETCPDIGQHSADNKTALDMARENGHADVVARIQEHIDTTCHGFGGPRRPLGSLHVDGCQELQCHYTCKWVRTGNPDPICVQSIYRIIDNGNATEFYHLLRGHPFLVNVTNTNGIPLLLTVMEQDQLEFAQILVDHGVDVNARAYNGKTPLIYAAEKDLLNYVTTLLSHDADINLQDEQGFTALHVASQHGHLRIVESLLKSCPDTSLLSADNKPALDHARELGHTDIVNILEGHIRTTCHGFGEPNLPLGTLHYDGCQESRCEHTCKWVITGNFDPQCESSINQFFNEKNASMFGSLVVGYPFLSNVTDADGIPLLFTAVNQNLGRFVRIMADNGADLNVRPVSGVTPLLRATEKGYSQIFNILLQYGSNTDLADDQGTTPLISATELGFTDFAKKLLEHKASVDLQNLETGITALHAACQQGNLQIAELLLNKCANTNILDTSGKTARDFCVENGHDNIVSIIDGHRDAACRWDDAAFPLGATSFHSSVIASSCNAVHFGHYTLVSLAACLPVMMMMLHQGITQQLLFFMQSRDTLLPFTRI